MGEAKISHKCPLRILVTAMLVCLTAAAQAQTI